MTIHDAKVEVSCDGEHCFESIEIEPPYVYGTYSGSSGRYDTDDDTLEPLIEAEGWLVDGEKHYCEGCQEGRGA